MESILNSEGPTLIETVLSNWPVYAAIFGLLVMFDLARRNVRKAKAKEAADDLPRWTGEDVTSDDDFIAKYPPPGFQKTEPSKPQPNFDDFFSNTARRDELKGASPAPD